MKCWTIPGDTLDVSGVHYCVTSRTQRKFQGMHAFVCWEALHVDPEFDVEALLNAAPRPLDLLPF